MPTSTNSPVLIHGAAVNAICGGVHYQTILRWRRNPKLGFPKPITINGRNYWREDEVVSWLISKQEVANESAA